MCTAPLKRLGFKSQLHTPGLRNIEQIVKLASPDPSTEFVLHPGSFPLGNWPQDQSCPSLEEGSLLAAGQSQRLDLFPVVVAPSCLIRTLSPHFPPPPTPWKSRGGYQTLCTVSLSSSAGCPIQGSHPPPFPSPPPFCVNGLLGNG